MEQPQSIALLLPEIKELLAAHNYALLKQVIRECSPMDFADCWRGFSPEERIQIFRLLPATSALKLFEMLEIDDQRFVLEKSSDDSVFPILEGMGSPELAKVFHKISPRTLRKMTSLIKRQEALAHIDYLMKFPEQTVGSLMRPEFVKLSSKLTSKQALLLLQAVIRPKQKEHLHSLFVTDDEGHVMGSLGLHDLIVAPEDLKLSELMDSVQGIRLKPDMDQEEASKIFSKYQISAAPVTDESGKLLGVVTAKDIISVVKQEATEDIVKMAGTQSADLQERSVFRIARIRMPWLFVTLLGGTLISLIIRSFEPLLARVIALASFSPLIAGLGGNVGSQSATIVVRSIALGNIRAQKRVATIFREFGVGLVLGLVYATALAGIAYLAYGQTYGLRFSFVVAVSMCAAMTVAATMGAVGPMIFEKMGVDPATATGPMVTTTTDIVSNLIYFTLATLLLSGF